MAGVMSDMVFHSSGPYFSHWGHTAHLIPEACLEWATFSLGTTINLSLYYDGACRDV